MRTIDSRTEFEKLLSSCRNALERLVYFKTKNRHDGDDLLQEIYLTAYAKYATLRDKTKFKYWILTIARNKLRDYYAKQAQRQELSLDEKALITIPDEQNVASIQDIVQDTIQQLKENDRNILWLHYMEGWPLAEIAAQLSLPLGTVKSRLHYAKRGFRARYPHPMEQKGVVSMFGLPAMMPEVSIEKADLPIFPVTWEELQGWFIVPRLNETCRWGIYDYPQRVCAEAFELKVMGKAVVHGVEGVEIIAREANAAPADHQNDDMSRTFVAQLTDTHSRFLLESHCRDGARYTYTFLDEAFVQNWGFGEENIGNRIHISPQGRITKEGSAITTTENPAIDVVGRYRVTLGEREYDTILVIDIEKYNDGVMSETYLDANGRTVLWRRFNKENWAFDRYQRLWTKALPENERVSVDGETYVHWYSCLTDAVL